MLAMYVVLENYLAMVCDYPEAYEGQPGFEFLKEVPTVWDETRVLDARVGEYILIARRKNQDWYIGCISNHQARQLSIPLNFLAEGKYDADIYTDAPDAGQDPNHLIKRSVEVSKTGQMPVQLAGGGGAVLHIRKK
jgi:alpha-glucosidase